MDSAELKTITERHTDIVFSQSAHGPVPSGRVSHTASIRRLRSTVRCWKQTAGNPLCGGRWTDNVLERKRDKCNMRRGEARLQE